VVERAAALLGDSEVATWLREAYRPGESLGSAFALLFARLFTDFGVILLDPADKNSTISQNPCSARLSGSPTR